MSWDTKYRPVTYADVVGQDHISSILREYVRQGKGLSQSVLFAGPWGGGKTTIARIYARALLCKNPVDGNPCDSCLSCTNMITTGSTDGFVEMDAATHSGKSDVKAILDELDFHTFSGSHRIYVIDESHRLSKDALDALLKSLEDNIPGTQNKRLVCLFCTTEPEKMRATVLSRCAPAFVIRPLAPEYLADRLEFICSTEGVEADRDALIQIAYATECHVRDAIKALEGIALSGSVSLESASKFLHLDTHDQVFSVVEAVFKGDLPGVMGVLDGLIQRMSPGEIYKKILEVLMLAYQARMSPKGIAPYWDARRLIALVDQAGEVRLLQLAQRMSSAPHGANASLLKCDLALFLHGPLVQFQTIVSLPQASLKDSVHKPASQVTSQITNGVYIDQRGVSNGRMNKSAYSISKEAFEEALVSEIVKMRSG